MPDAGVASRWTAAPTVELCEQVALQLIDPSGDVTVPPPATVMFNDGLAPIPVVPAFPVTDEPPPQA